MKRRARTSIALAAALALTGSLAALPSGGGGPRAPARRAVHALLPEAHAEEPARRSPPSAPPPASSPSPLSPLNERADAHLVRSWRAPLAGGLLTFPPSFSSEDGRYDLVIHLNGNTDLVEESYGYAGVNAVVMILNLGVGSGVYEDRFAVDGSFDLILDRVQSVLTERGLRSPRLGRVAVSGWSSGYGGVIKLLQRDSVFDRIDAVLLFDSIHCGVDVWTGKQKPDQIEPIQRFARKAAAGRALLSITHSDIETHGYLDAHKTTDVVLRSVGVHRTRAAQPQPMPALRSMIGVMPKAKMLPLPPLTEAHQGGLHVRGYSGNGPITHMLHLVQMSTTALPDLVARWRS